MHLPPEPQPPARCFVWTVLTITWLVHTMSQEPLRLQTCTYGKWQVCSPLVAEDGAAGTVRTPAMLCFMVCTSGRYSHGPLLACSLDDGHGFSLTKGTAQTHPYLQYRPSTSRLGRSMLERSTQGVLKGQPITKGLATDT
jgi:hypothetical protein